MKLIQQPRGSNLCGQACIATLAGISLENAIQLTNRTGKTKTADLKRALLYCGFRPADRRTRGMPNSDVTALLWWTNGKDCHWTVWHGGKHYDPAAGVFRKTPKHLENARVTSHLKVEWPQ